MSDNVDDAPYFDLSNEGVGLATTGGGLDRHLERLLSLREEIISGAVSTGHEAG